MDDNGTIIRSEQRLVVTVIALIFGPLFMLGPAAVGVWFLIGTQFRPITFAAFAILISLSGFIAYHMMQNYQWVELDGDTIRGRRFWTRQFIERDIADIFAIVPLGAVTKSPENVIVDDLLGPVRGYEIRFKGGGRKIALVRFDMTNVEPLIQALAARTKLASSS